MRPGISDKEAKAINKSLDKAATIATALFCGAMLTIGILIELGF